MNSLRFYRIHAEVLTRCNMWQRIPAATGAWTQQMAILVFEQTAFHKYTNEQTPAHTQIKVDNFISSADMDIDLNSFHIGWTFWNVCMCVNGYVYLCICIYLNVYLFTYLFIYVYLIKHRPSEMLLSRYKLYKCADAKFKYINTKHKLSKPLRSDTFKARYSSRTGTSFVTNLT